MPGRPWRLIRPSTLCDFFENIFDFLNLFFGDEWLVLLGSFCWEFGFCIICYCFWNLCLTHQPWAPRLEAGVGEC